MSDEPSEEIEHLQHKITKLEAENEQLKTILKTEGKVGLWLTKIGFRFFLGQNLTHSIRAWRKAAWEQKRIPDQETDELIAAILRRWVLQIGLTALIAVVPPVLTLFLLTQQNTLIRSQIEQQAQLNDINRRAQLLATLYDRTDCGAENSEDCPLQASIRARVEATKAFVEMERIMGNQPDLSWVDLREGDLRRAVLTEINLSHANLISTTLFWADLFEADLEGANLRGADLFMADLRGANLSGEANLARANLAGADLSQANLIGANLSEANLFRANLFDADLFKANLSQANLNEADLREADLRGAYLRETEIDDRTQLEGVEYDKDTIWPKGFDAGQAGAKLVE
ncbi:MAG: pentapeptide repeat-containing protein [Anaerolineae bacterium]|nr:pentapeptide repeat-containing protein [Anaerolineae bacterium]